MAGTDLQKRWGLILGLRALIMLLGGIATVDDAWARSRAGASLIQLYSALVYEGPGLARRIARGLAERTRAEGMGSIAEAVGSE